MKIALISHSFEGLGLEYLSASLKRAGHETALFYDPCLFDDMMLVNGPLSKFFSERSAIIKRLVRWEPDLVGISVLSDFYMWAADMARRVKQAYPVPVVMGGMHATSVPDVVIRNPHVDYIVQGEGDETIVDLVEALQSGSDTSGIPNIWSKRNGDICGNAPRPLIRDLDSLPFPDKSLYEDTFIPKLRMYIIMASRGCPYQCSYCNSALLREIYKGEKGSFCRLRSTDNVMEELKWADRDGKIGVVNFYDEVFGADIRWLREFAPRYRREIGKPFLAVTHPGHCSQEYVDLLKEAGCAKIDLGVQSTDPEIRKNVLRRRETNDQIANAIDRIMAAGIFLQVENIFNLPGQNEENTREMIRFYNRHRPHGLKCYGLRLFPRTPIERMAIDSGLIRQEYAYRNARGEILTSDLGLLGGAFFNPSLSHFQTLASIMLFLPPRWVDSIIDRRLYRYLPYSRYTIILSRVVNSQSWEEDIFRRIIAGRYKHHLALAAKSAFAGAKS